MEISIQTKDMKTKKKELRIKVKELTGVKYRRLRKFCEKGNEKIDVESINYNPQTKLTQLWVNLSGGYGNCWMPLDGGLSGNEPERIEKVRIVGGHKGYRVLLFFKRITRKTSRTSRTMSVASVKFLEELRYNETPQEIRRIKGKIPLSRAYKILLGRYAGCYAINMPGYWSPPLFRTNFDCGIYDGEGGLMSI